MSYPAVTRPRPRRARRSLPLTEAVEPRVLLSAYTVTNLNDAGPGSLRDAVQQANAHAGPDTIDFASGLSGTISLTSGPLSVSDTSGTTTVVGTGLSVSGSNALTLPQITIAAGASASFSNAYLTGLLNHGNTAVTQCDAAAQLYNDGGTLNVAGSILTNAGARQSGGSIYNNGGSVTIDQGMFFQDDPYASDSQILSNGGSVVLRNSTVHASGSDAAKGVVATGGTLLMVQDSLWTGSQDISIGSANAKLVNCTLLSIGIDPAAAGADVTLYNTIVASAIQGTLDQHLSPGQVSSSYNLIGTSTAGGLLNGMNGNLVGVNPQLNFSPGDFGGPVYSLLPKAGSPAIDAGSNTLAQDLATQPAAALSTD